MKKILFLFVLLIFTTVCYSQSVLGIPFGSSFSTVKSQLQDRFGYYSVTEDNGTLKLYNDFSMGDYTFNFASFEFQRSGSLSYFNFAYFERRFGANQITAAKESRDYLFSLLKGKYEDDFVDDYINDQGFKCYNFGQDPKEPQYTLGRIILSRGQGKDGKTRLYLKLIYGPIHYLSKSSDF